MVGPKSSAVDVGLVFGDSMRAAPAVAWEDTYPERVPVDVQPEVRVSNARPNEVLEERALCSQEKSGSAWEEFTWHLRCMRRDPGEAGCGARNAVLNAVLRLSPGWSWFKWPVMFARGTPRPD